MPQTTDNPDLIEQHYTLLSNTSEKCKTYECVYCRKRYAQNVTRMKLHLKACAKCPPHVKNNLKIKRHKYTITKALLAKLKEDSTLLDTLDDTELIDSSDNLVPHYVSSTPLESLLSENDVNKYVAESSKRARIQLPQNDDSDSSSLVYTHFSKLPNQPSDKSYNYECNHCKKKYAKNVTRMKEHLINCTKCPKDVQETLKIKRRTLTSEEVSKSLQQYASPTAEHSFDVTEIVPAASSSSSQPKILVSTQRRPSKKETTLMWMSMARACYASTMSFNFVENPYWVACFKKINPGLLLPSRDHLATSLLDNEYVNVKNLVQEKVLTSTSFCLQIYGWTNVKSNSTLNITAITTSGPVLYETVYGVPSMHTSTYFTQRLTELLDKVGVEKCTSIITDTTLCQEKISTLVKTKYPKAAIACYQCCSLTLHHFIEEILAMEFFKQLLTISTSIVATINSIAPLRSAFKHIRASFNDTTPLTEPNKINRTSTVTSLRNFVTNENPLKMFALTDAAGVTAENVSCLEFLTDETFWINIKALSEFLQPIVNVINVLDESTENLISSMSGFMQTIRKHLQATVPELAIKFNFDKNALLDSFAKHRLMSFSAVHYAANLLDPRTRGDTLTGDEIIEGISYISTLATTMKLDKNEVISDLALYRTKQGLWSKKFVWDALNSAAEPAKELTATSWWNGICSSSQLAKIASAVLLCPTTITTSDNRLKTYTAAHAKTLNRLSTEKACKLTYITHNLGLLNDKMKSLKGALSTVCDEEDQEVESANEDEMKEKETVPEVGIDRIGLEDITTIDCDEENYDYSIYVYSDTEENE